MKHSLKIKTEYFNAVVAGTKRAELRYNDRKFKTGDLVSLKEFNGDYTGNMINGKITHILVDHEGLAEGFVMLSIEVHSVFL